jgi:hypothetical protein
VDIDLKRMNLEIEKLRGANHKLSTAHDAKVRRLIKAHDRELDALVMSSAAASEHFRVASEHNVSTESRLGRRIRDLEKEVEGLRECEELLRSGIKDVRADLAATKKERNVLKSNLKNNSEGHKESMTKKREQLKEMEATHRERHETMLANLNDLVEKSQAKKICTKGGVGGSCTLDFERHVRRLLSTEATAEAIREGIIMNAEFFIPDDEARKGIEVPEVRWIQKQREAMGAESWLYGMMAIFQANEVLQFGFDETMLQRTSTMNQWCLMRREEGGEVEVVTIETAGIMVGSTSQDVADLCEKTWKRGQAACLLLREKVRQKVGDDRADELFPMVNGGVMLHKLRSTMHDTCHGANLAAKLIADKKEESAREFYGDEAWEAMSEDDRATSDFRRGNHSRNLPVAAFNRLFTAYMNDELGEQF